jgi:putative transposase
MNKTNKSNKKSHFHAVYDLNYHLVLVTKYRNKVINQAMLERLHQIFLEQCEHWSVRLVEFNGEADHVHLLINAHPAMDLSKFINSIKTVSSRLIRKEYKERVSKYYWKPYFWTRAYCLLTTGGAPLEVIKAYIQNQDSPNK